jgi:hypothetical protein
MEDGKFTMFAGKSVALAEVFKYTVGKEPFVGPTVCRLDLSAPTEESTDGGRLAVQHVSIVPEGGGPSTVMVTVYQVEQRVEGRQYEVVADTYKKRFHTSSFPVSPGQFDEMTRKLKEFFKQFGFKFEMAPLQAMRPSAPAPRATGGAPVPGAAPVAKRPTATHGAPGRTATRSAVIESRGGSRLWIVVLAALAAAVAGAGVVIYLLHS